MKKNAIIFILSFICTSAFAQLKDITCDLNNFSVDATTGKITFIKIDSIPGMSKDALFSKALEWVAVNFRDANSVIKLQDRLAGKIVVKGYSEQNYSIRVLGNDYDEHYGLWYQINITCKRGRYRIVFTDFYVKAFFIGSDYYKAQEIPLEEYLSRVRKAKKFDALTRNEKKQLLAYKQILNNAYTETINNINSVVDLLFRSNIKVVDKDGDF